MFTCLINAVCSWALFVCIIWVHIITLLLSNFLTNIFILLGQFAITYFKVVYRPAYLGGAIVIACVAVTAALFIFFKLREKWMNQWYKRLGCALLMALAVCGMHYTGLVGTDFFLPDYDTGNTIPLPKLKTAALIGIIAAIIVIACIVLLVIGIKAGMQNLPMYTKNTNKRLILDSVMFDPIGRVLVKIDGTLPMTEIVHNLELNVKNNKRLIKPTYLIIFLGIKARI